MTVRSTLTEKDVLRIIKMKNQGKAIKDIALVFHKSEQYIGKILKGKKLQKWTKGLLPKSQNYAQKLSDTDVKNIIQMRKQQFTQQEIADKFKVSQAIISKICLGLNRRKITDNQKYIFNCKHCDKEFEKQYNVQEFCCQHCRMWFYIKKPPFKIFQPSPCFLWTLDKDKDGYGKISWKKDNGKLGNKGVARLVLEEKLGRKLKPGMHACHTCDNPSCCNPKHLYEGTPRNNKHDSIYRDRHAYGEKDGNSKLKEYEVKMIVRGLKVYVTHKQLAYIFNVSHQTIANISSNISWKHVSRF